MGYITRNANIILLFIILIAATALVGATVYFQQRFDSINGEYNSKLVQLQNVSSQLEQYQGILTKAREELVLKGSREEELTTKFTDVKSEKETLAEQNDQLLADKQSLQLNLGQTTSKLTLAQNTITVRDATIVGLNSDIKTLKSKVTHLENTIDCLQSTVDASEGDC